MEIGTVLRRRSGNPSDESLLSISLQEPSDRLGCSPWELASDRGSYSKDNEQLCTATGVPRVSMPRKGETSAERRKHQQNPGSNVYNGGDLARKE